jgi:hypothetical protein
MNKKEMEEKIEEWHNSDSELPVHEYIGVSLEEYYNTILEQKDLK